MAHANSVWTAVQGSTERCGVITSFPQLAMCVGLRKRMARATTPLVAGTFNLGKLYRGVKREIARIALSSVDRFIVHSTAEIESYSRWLDLPSDRFRFVPLLCPDRRIALDEDREHPFVLSMGSAKRDYALLFDVLGELKLPAVIVAAPYAVAGLSVPANVRVRSGLSANQCFELVQRARINVIPVANRETASGQVTLLDAMMFARPIVATSCVGSVDYAANGHEALLVQPGSRNDLTVAIERLWEDSILRETLSLKARATVIARCSDEPVGREMGSILRELR